MCFFAAFVHDANNQPQLDKPRAVIMGKSLKAGDTLRPDTFCEC